MRQFRFAIGILAALAATVGVASAIVGSRPTPIFTGPNPQAGKGFGQIKPRTIYMGGDETGLVCRIHWLSWGGQLAIGTGTGWYINSHESVSQGHPAPVVVVLYRLGIWQGRPAYTKWTWYYPGNGSGFGQVRVCSV